MTPKLPTSSPTRPSSRPSAVPYQVDAAAGGTDRVVSSGSSQAHHSSLQTSVDFDRLFDLLGEQCRVIDQLCDLSGQTPPVSRGDDQEPAAPELERWLATRREMIGVITELEGRLAADWPGWEKLEQIKSAEFCAQLDQMLQQRRTQLDRLNEADDLLRRQIEVNHRQIRADLSRIDQGGRALGAYRQNGRTERPDARFTDQEI